MRYAQLEGLKWVGDLSLPDADVLVHFGRKSKRVLEFGVGGSTHLLAQCKPDVLISLDTSKEWLDITNIKLAKIKDKTNVNLHEYADLQNIIDSQTEPFDLIFDDGIDELRLEFAKKTWNSLAVGGIMLFHDTRRQQDVANVLNTVLAFHEEVNGITLNIGDSFGNTSNMSAIVKKVPEPYVNWNFNEGRPEESYHAYLTDINHPLWNYSTGKFED